jgi:hypothetical protein
MAPPSSPAGLASLTAGYSAAGAGAEGEDEVAPIWELDADATKCPGEGCGKQFHLLTLRKHHCRGCGAVFCAGCSRHLLQLSPMAAETLAAGRPAADPVRTCQDCFARLSSVEHSRPYDVHGAVDAP